MNKWEQRRHMFISNPPDEDRGLKIGDRVRGTTRMDMVNSCLHSDPPFGTGNELVEGIIVGRLTGTSCGPSNGWCWMVLRDGDELLYHFDSHDLTKLSSIEIFDGHRNRS